MKDYKKLIILGAPRSGTNMLRNVLCNIDKVDTWPCDEINYIWRHGNLSYPTDEIPVQLLNTSISRYINRQFDWVNSRSQASFVVEKTAANCLRVEFVKEILPDAHFLYIYRNGVDVIASAMKRWSAALDLPYLLRKARFVPLSDLPHYATRYLWSRVYLQFSKNQRLAFWGPRISDFESILEQHPLDEICALQWERCVTMAEESLSKIPSQQKTTINYETFVENPELELIKVLERVGISYSNQAVTDAVASVSNLSVGKGTTILRHDIQRLHALVGRTIERTINENE